MTHKKREELDALLSQLEAAIPALIDGQAMRARQDRLALRAESILDGASLELFDYVFSRLEAMFRKHDIYTHGPARHDLLAVAGH